MTEYIDRESIRKAFQNVIDDPKCLMFIAATIEQYIAEEPAADVVPVVHGRWVYNSNYKSWEEMYVCSVYNRNALTGGDYRHELSDYCPNCGAKMDLED